MSNPEPSNLIDKIETRQAVISVIGLGYVGLPLAVAFAEAGFPVTGIDVDATWQDHFLLADDYLCTQPGPITEITIWGSWLGDYYGDDPTAVSFTLSIHDDIPQGPGGWSIPGEPLWLFEFQPGMFDVRVQASEIEEKDFRVLMDSMNLRIEDCISNWVANVETVGLVRPEDGARLFHELTGIIVLTYDEMDVYLPQDWREATGPEFKLFDFIDPSAAEPGS